MYIFEGLDNGASIIHRDSDVDLALSLTGMHVTELPNIVPEAGKEPMLKVNVAEGRIWYDYIDIPVETKSELQMLQTDVLDIQMAVAAMMGM